jgi:hypothetical protein
MRTTRSDARRTAQLALSRVTMSKGHRTLEEPSRRPIRHVRWWSVCAVSGITCVTASTVCAETPPTAPPAGTSTSGTSTSGTSTSGTSTSGTSTSGTSTSGTSTSGGAASPGSRVPAWLPWTFAGLGAAAALTGVIAWRLRERYVARYNGEACLEAGKTRVQACSDDYYAGRDAEAVVWVTGISSVAFLGSALFLGRTGAAVSASASQVTVEYSGSF